MDLSFHEPFAILYVEDPERSVAFYRDAFGFDLDMRWPPEGDELDYASLSLGPHKLGITRRSVPKDLIGRTAATRESPPRFELCFLATDTDAAAEHLRTLGARELRPAENMPWGERMAFFEDPDGNPLHIRAPVDSGLRSSS
jgi:lactoylglutathione lyase